MTSAVYKDILDAGVGKKFECIFDQRSVRERKKTLGRLADRRTGKGSRVTLGRSRVKGLNLVSNESARTYKVGVSRIE